MVKIDLTQVQNHTEVEVVEINGNTHFQEKVEAMGLRIGMRVKKLSAQVMHGPVTIRIGNTRIAIGYGMAKKIMVNGN